MQTNSFSLKANGDISKRFREYVFYRYLLEIFFTTSHFNFSLLWNRGIYRNVKVEIFKDAIPLCLLLNKALIF